MTVHFGKLISDLGARGWDHGRIAEKAGCSRAVIYQIAKGNTIEPRYNLGAALVDLERRTRPRK